MQERVSLGTSTGFSARIAGGSDAALSARQLVTAELGEVVPEETLYDLLLMTTELVTNAVRHAGVDETRTLDMQVAFEGPLIHVSVFDPGGETDPRLRHPNLETPGGMGLFLVDQLSSRWGVERGRDGSTQVWFEIGDDEREVPEEPPAHRIPLPRNPHPAPRHVAVVAVSSALS